MDELRPRGTVEVQCSHPGCGVCWWVSPLDPRVQSQDWDCGDDHEAARSIRDALDLLRAQTGLAWCQMGAKDPDDCNKGIIGCGFGIRKGYTYIKDRVGRGNAYLEWDDPQEINTVDKILARLEWDESRQQSGSKSELIPEGMVWTNGYRHYPNSYQSTDPEVIRVYTMVPCSRPGCQQQVKVDYHEPERLFSNWAIGGWSRYGGAKPKPDWWGEVQVTCDGGLGGGPYGQPCRFIHGQAILDFERSGVRWTIWEDEGRDKKSGEVLFWDPEPRLYGLLRYENETPFESRETVFRTIQWGSARHINELSRKIRIPV